MKKACVYLPLTAVLLLGGWRASGDDIDKVLKEIAEKTKNHKSYQAKVHTETKISSQGYKNETTSIGSMEYVRTGDNKYKMRNESKARSVTEVSGDTQRTETTTLIIDDGEFMYMYSETNGQKSAQKMKSNASTETMDDPFKVYREHYDLALLPEEDVDGHATHVIEAKPKAGSPIAATSGSTVSYYRKSDGAMLKSVTYGTDGKPMSTMTWTEVKVNGKISADRFVFKAPPGVEVQDLTKQQTYTGEETEAEPKAEAKKKPESKKDEKKKPEKKIKLPKLKKKWP